MPDHLSECRTAIIDNAVDHSVYTPVEHWSPHIPNSWKSYRAIKGELPDLDEGFTHIILTGSEATIMEREAWTAREVEFVQEAVSRDLAILGSCYGHQLLALAICGPRAIRRAPYPEAGWISVPIVKSNILFGRETGFDTFTFHFDEVKELDDDFKILASTPVCRIQAFQYKDKNIWGLQPHPEIDIPTGKKLLKDVLGKGERSRKRLEEALSGIPVDSRHIKIVMKNFFCFKKN